MKKLLITILVVATSFNVALSKNVSDEITYPKVGDRCPDFILKDIRYYKTKTVKSEDLKGRYVILDFFNRFCTSCFESFPKVNKLQEQFKDKLDVFLVGEEDKVVGPMFDRFRKMNNLNLPVTFDTKFIKKLVPEGMGYPYQIWIGPDGIIKAIVGGSRSMTVQSLEAFLNGGKPVVKDGSNALDSLIEKRIAAGEDWSIYIDPLTQKDPMTHGKKDQVSRDTTIIFGSQIGKWNKTLSMAPGFMSFPNDESQEKFFPKNNAYYTKGTANLEHLYLYALFGNDQWSNFVGGFDDYKPEADLYGKCWPKAILNVKDVEAFHGSMANERLYWYKQVISRSMKNEVKNILKDDLYRIFGYQALIEIRKMPYLKLVVVNQKRIDALRTKGGKVSFNTDKFTFLNSNNADWRFFYTQLVRNAFARQIEVILDETGLSGNFDFNLKGNLHNLDDFKKILNSIGLDLQPAQKEMKVLVISDPVSVHN